jgi:hypothetical protein
MPWYAYSVVGGYPQPIVEVWLRYGGRSVPLLALVDSGADVSLLDVSLADMLGLDRATAVIQSSIGASGVAFATLEWPAASIEFEFDGVRFPFRGSFVDFPADADGMNLLGRGDFFQRFIVQFWDAAELMNIDLSPDFPHPPYPR